eukprot:CAMPEP_0196658626 /NCGR_PEP_ID=MMETSP1086-20130531/30635_1 /TAXON_ID=77921 /ORGANISM="Cyanoptyche  gloeocystis , Strain SAG4.97" /LENGTH=187 /DNA_ID=CAMNT_0041992277 /DNA_START=262 /DNA_END=825 /DNA_ORIENTATION=-
MFYTRDAVRQVETPVLTNADLKLKKRFGFTNPGLTPVDDGQPIKVKNLPRFVEEEIFYLPGGTTRASTANERFIADRLMRQGLGREVADDVARLFAQTAQARKPKGATLDIFDAVLEGWASTGRPFESSDLSNIKCSFAVGGVDGVKSMEVQLKIRTSDSKPGEMPREPMYPEPQSEVSDLQCDRYD